MKDGAQWWISVGSCSIIYVAVYHSSKYVDIYIYVGGYHVDRYHIRCYVDRYVDYYMECFIPPVPSLI